MTQGNVAVKYKVVDDEFVKETEYPKAPWNTGYDLGNFDEEAEYLLKSLTETKDVTVFENQLIAIKPFFTGDALSAAEVLLTPYNILQILQKLYPAGHAKHEDIGSIAYEVGKYIGCDGYDILIETLMSWKVA